VRSQVGFFLGDTRIRLLEAVAEHGSITRTAKAVPLSYRAAWDAIDEMNNLAALPLVTRSVGGRHVGGAVHTTYGLKMIALFRVLEVHCGPVNAEVTIELPGGRTLSTTVTRTSADELQLEPGIEAQVLMDCRRREASSSSTNYHVVRGGVLPESVWKVLIERRITQRIARGLDVDLHDMGAALERSDESSGAQVLRGTIGQWGPEGEAAHITCAQRHHLCVDADLHCGHAKLVL
jgi:molybdate transport repressor ModE-like protein